MSSIFDITPPPLDGETPYFQGSEVPVREGVYKRIYYGGEGWGKPSFCYWDGEKWFSGAAHPEYAILEPMVPSAYQPFRRDGCDFAWCGVMPVELSHDEALAQIQEVFDEPVDNPLYAGGVVHDEPAEPVEEQLDLPLEEPNENADFFEA